MARRVRELEVIAAELLSRIDAMMPDAYRRMSESNESLCFHWRNVYSTVFEAADGLDLLACLLELRAEQAGAPLIVGKHDLPGGAGINSAPDVVLPAPDSEPATG